MRQLARWVEYAGKLALPKTPAQWPPDWRSRLRSTQVPPSVGQFVAENMPMVHAQQEAVRAVRAVSGGKSRDELRALLRSELSSREVSMQPVPFEQTLESLATEQEPFGKARIALRGVRALWDLGHSPTPRVFPDRPSEPSEDEPDPAWLKTPERAAYPIRLSGRDRVAVELNPAAVTLLDSAMSASGAGMVQTRNVEVWFGSHNEPSSSVSRLSVHIGSQCVGELDAEATERFRPVLEAAAERDEDPWADAHVTRLPGGPLTCWTFRYPRSRAFERHPMVRQTITERLGQWTIVARPRLIHARFTVPLFIDPPAYRFRVVGVRFDTSS